MLANVEAKLTIENIVDRHSSVSELFKTLQKRTISPSEAMATIYLASASFENFAKEKLDDVLTKNRGLDNLRKGKLENLSAEETQLMAEHCPIASVDVERSFSVYKRLLTDNRKRFSSDNLYHHLLVARNN